MKVTNSKMKLLSLAILGLGGLALAGSASAACTATPDAWSSTSSLGGTLAISSPGLDSSTCKLDASINVDGPVNAFVRDDSPSSEPSYRAQFRIDADALGAQNSIEGFKAFGAFTDTSAHSITELVRLNVFGNISGTQRTLGIVTACAVPASGYLCSATVPLTAGINIVEIEWKKGTSGELNVWVNSNSEGSPTTTLPVNNNDWAGIDYVSLGIGNPSPGFRGAHLNQIVSFDAFDSRRSTFIGY